MLDLGLHGNGKRMHWIASAIPAACISLLSACCSALCAAVCLFSCSAAVFPELLLLWSLLSAPRSALLCCLALGLPYFAALLFAALFFAALPPALLCAFCSASAFRSVLCYLSVVLSALLSALLSTPLSALA